MNGPDFRILLSDAKSAALRRSRDEGVAMGLEALNVARKQGALRTTTLRDSIVRSGLSPLLEALASADPRPIDWANFRFVWDEPTAQTALAIEGTRFFDTLLKAGVPFDVMEAPINTFYETGRHDDVLAWLVENTQTPFFRLRHLLRGLNDISACRAKLLAPLFVAHAHDVSEAVPLAFSERNAASHRKLAAIFVLIGVPHDVLWRCQNEYDLTPETHDIISFAASSHRRLEAHRREPDIVSVLLRNEEQPFLSP